jgi:hypothetical protein
MNNDGFPEGSPQKESKPVDTSGQEPPRPEPELPRWAMKGAKATPLLDSRLAAFIGPRWESSYRAKLARFVADPAFTPTWNWAAALGSPFWFLYRKLYLAFAAFYLAPTIALPFLTGSTEQLTMQNAQTPEGRQFAMMGLAVILSTMIAAGGTANWLLFRRARAATIVVTAQQLPEDAALSFLQRIGGVNLMPAVLFLVLSLVFGLSALRAA